MRYVSTHGASPPVDLKTAIARGLAPDGGLYTPVTVEPMDPSQLASLWGAPLGAVALAVAEHQMGDALPRDVLQRIVAEAIDFEIPLHPLDDRTWVLELFHGPTLAFKDVGARTLARLVRHLRGREPLTVLVATSGDTGGAVAHAFFGLEGTRVVVLYPRGQVSRLQEAQFATLGGNVAALAVEGTFDDCQRLVKAAFAQPSMASLGLTSANSINIGRLLPQVWYSVYAALQLEREGDPVIFSVPSGNFGNLAAGLMAKRLGAPIAGFVAATNVNDVVPAYLETGVYEPRPSRPTISSAMDVGTPSNLERIRALYRDVDALRRDVAGFGFDDDATRATIADVDRMHGYLVDPHTAVGLLGLARVRERGQCRGVVLSTAHPAKFPEVVEPIVGRKVPPPQALAACLGRPLLSQTLPAETTVFFEWLRVDARGR